jgi:hypothetical protein
VLEKTRTPIWASQRTASSLAFLNSPVLLLEKVTCRLVMFSIFFITVFPRTMAPVAIERVYLLPHKPVSQRLICRSYELPGKIDLCREREREREMGKAQNTTRTLLFFKVAMQGSFFWWWTASLRFGNFHY